MSVFKKYERIFTKALKIRVFEKKLLELAGEKKISGTVHTCIGQELIPLAISENLTSLDYVFSNHRSHGHYLSLFEDFKGLAFEIMGHPDGVNHGIGGSQHLHRDLFFSSGIQGSMLGVALGTAFSQKEDGQQKLSVCYIGDGTFGEGILYEVLNIASKWELPLLIVVEDNFYAQSTPQFQTLAGTLQKRCEAFDLTYTKTSSFDLEELLQNTKSSIDFIREKQKPCVLHVETYRLSPHSKGDDNRSSDEIKKYEAKDLVEQFQAQVEKNFLKSIRDEIDMAFVSHETSKTSDLIKVISNETDFTIDETIHKKWGIRKEINLSLHNIFKKNKDIIMWGEDIEDPYGGAFKVTQGLSSAFKDRVKNTPISENAIIAMGIGRALAGKPTIVEIMFSDFIALAFDPIFNTGSKLVSMFGKKQSIPLIIRTANGPNSGYGATHSQDMSSVFYGTPFVHLYVPSKFTNFLELYKQLASQADSISIVFENKKMLAIMSDKLSERLQPYYKVHSLGSILRNSFLIFPEKHQADVTIVASPVLLEEIEETMLKMIDEEVFLDVFIPEYLNELPSAQIAKSLSKTKKLLILESVNSKGSWGQDLWYQLSKITSFKGDIIGTPSAAIPSGTANEKLYFSNVISVTQKIKEIYELR